MSNANNIADLVREKCQSHFDATYCECADVSSSGCGTKLELTIVSAVFSEKSPLARHRAVNSILKEEIASDIHALSIKAWTPEQWETK
uniref:BolA family transcriptional regulator n=1 Tax=Corethron hystrix TaxID=216773 RepID=A0A7S1BJQ6_9STRA